MEIIILLTLLRTIRGYFLAKENGRNERIALVICLVFGFFGLLGYWIAGKTDEKKQQEFKELLEREKLLAEARK